MLDVAYAYRVLDISVKSIYYLVLWMNHRSRV